jgi:hypothetical protein
MHACYLLVHTEFKTQRVPLLGPLYVDAWLLPILYVAFRYVQLGQDKVDLQQQLIGVVVGLAFKVYVLTCNFYWSSLLLPHQ